MPSLIVWKFSGSSFVLVGALAAALLALHTDRAAAVSQEVQSACMSDYFSHCSQHDVDSKGVRQCMRAAAARLSKPCVNALVASGEASAPKVDRRAGKSRRKTQVASRN